MATVRQILANRLNSEKSTGPTSQEGKAAARGNALKHGLTGAGVVVPHDDVEAIAVRMVEWRPTYQPAGSEDEWFFRELVTQSIRIDRCHEQEATLRSQVALRASLCWNDDRCLDVEQLADKLAKKPATITHQLTRTRQGCEWMIDRWSVLDALLEAGGEWTEAQRSLALDLLGTPLELRDPADDFGSKSDAPQARALIRTQIDRLEKCKTSALDTLDQFEREAAEQGHPLETPKSIAQLRRYEAACLKRFHMARNYLLAARPAEPKILEKPFQPAPIETKAPPNPAPLAPVPVAPLPMPRIESTRPIVRTASMAPARTEMNRQQRRAAEKLSKQSR